MKNFFNSPYTFSFKDMMAAVFIGSFLYFCWKAQSSKDALELVKSLVSLIGIILGGYFAQEAASMYFQQSQHQNYNSTVTSTIKTSSTPTQEEQNQAGPL